MKKYALLAGIICMLLFAGCQQAQDDPNASSGLTSAGGVKAESFLPEDAFMVMKFGTDDESQQKNMEKLSQYFPRDAWQALMVELSESFNEDFADLGASFEDDLLPAIGDDAQMLFGFSGTVQEDEEPDILVILSLADVSTIQGWMDTSIEAGSGTKQEYKSFGIYNGPGKESYITPYQDVLLIANSLEQMKEGLDRIERNGPSLLSNSSYQKGLAKVKDSLGYFYIDPRFSIEVIKNDAEAMEQFGDLTELENLVELIEGEFFAFFAEPHGIRIKGYVYGDPKKWKEMEEELTFEVDPAYLYKQLPGDGVLMYAEGANLQKSAQMMMKMYQHLEGFEEGMAQVRQALEAEGIDFDNDLLGFMDKGYAFGMYDSGMMVPSLGIFIDASSNRGGAEKVIGVLSEGVDAFEDGFKSEAPDEFDVALTHEKAATKGGDNSELSFDASLLSDETMGAAPEELRNLRLEFNYGITTDDLAYFAFYPDFELGSYETLGSQKTFTDDLALIPGYDRGVTYIDVQAIMAYVDRIVAYIVAIEGGSIEDMAEYELVKSYILPIKSIVFAAKESGEGEAEMEGFIRIGEGGMKVPGMLVDPLEVSADKASCIASCEVMAGGKEVVDECIEQCE